MRDHFIFSRIVILCLQQGVFNFVNLFNIKQSHYNRRKYWALDPVNIITNPDLTSDTNIYLIM